MTKYSFIMPVYNSSDTLKLSIQSIINQTYKDWELIAIDDGSIDNSYEILKEYAKLDDRIKSYTKENSGPGKTRNYAITKATGDYIVFIDSDDYYEKDALEQIEQVNFDKKYDLIFINTINEQKDGRVDYVDNLHKFFGCSKNELLKLQMTGKLPWGPCSKIVKSEIVKKCKFLDISVGEEAIYSFDLLNFSKNWFFLEKPLYHYVHNDVGQHKKGGLDPWRNVVELLKKHLIKEKRYEEFELAINSLAINSMLMAIYRVSTSYTFLNARKELKKVIKKYNNDFLLNKSDKKLINFSSKMLFYLVKLHCYSLLIILSKIRKKFYK